MTQTYIKNPDGTFAEIQAKPRLNRRKTVFSCCLFYNTNAGFGAGIGMYAGGATALTRIAA